MSTQVLSGPARRQAFGLALLIAAYLALVPGVTHTVIDLTGYVEQEEIKKLGRDMIAADDEINRIVRGVAVGLINTLDASGSVQVYHQERSIIGTVRELWTQGNRLVGFLVALFSIIIPVLKGLLLLGATLGMPGRVVAERIAHGVGKWSMADVFIVAIIVSLLAANASENSGELVRFDARFGEGFYWFLTYCILSIASAQLLRPRR